MAIGLEMEVFREKGWGMEGKEWVGVFVVIELAVVRKYCGLIFSFIECWEIVDLFKFV